MAREARVNEYGLHRSAYWPPLSLSLSPFAKCCSSTLLTCHAEAQEAGGVARDPAGREWGGGVGGCGPGVVRQAASPGNGLTVAAH